MSEASSNRRPSKGFTLVELLVVIAIIAMLLGILLPAVQRSRESGRQLACKNNIRQLAIALTNRESVYRSFPNAFEFCPATYSPNYSGKSSSSCMLGDFSEFQYVGKTWAIDVLPFVEQSAVHAAFDFAMPISDSTNAAARGIELSVMKCPTDYFNRQQFNGTNSPNTVLLGDGWSRGNYAGNSCLGSAENSSEGNAGGGPQTAMWQKFPGVMGASCSKRSSEIVDGLSKTVLLGEVRSGLTAADPRGTWALCKSPSSLWGHGGVINDDDHGPNNSSEQADNIASCSTVRASFSESLATFNMGCYEADCVNQQQTTRSLHVGGVFVAMADGSVRWIADFIQAFPSSEENLSVWDRLMCSRDGQVVGYE